MEVSPQEVQFSEDEAAQRVSLLDLAAKLGQCASFAMHAEWDNGCSGHERKLRRNRSPHSTRAPASR